MRRLLQRAWHLLERIIREIKRFPKTARAFGAKVAFATFWDGLHPLGKQPRYIATVETYVDRVLEGLVQEYQSACDEPTVKPDGKLPVWCCWWQGEEYMPELVRCCVDSLKRNLPQEKTVFPWPNNSYTFIISLSSYPMTGPPACAGCQLGAPSSDPNYTIII